jgi:hypothetical protein
MRTSWHQPRAIWLSAPQFRRFDKAMSAWKHDNPDKIPSLEIIKGIVGSLETDMELVSDRILDVLKDAGLFNPDTDLRAKASKILANDTALQRLIKTSSV